MLNLVISRNFSPYKIKDVTRISDHFGCAGPLGRFRWNAEKRKQKFYVEMKNSTKTKLNLHHTCRHFRLVIHNYQKEENVQMEKIYYG